MLLPEILSSIIEVAKEPPCGNPDASLRPDTKLRVDVDARTSALLVRGMLGWFWHLSDFAYMTLQLGATKPTRVTRKVKVIATLDSPSDSDEEVTGALAQVKAEREADLERKAIKEMRPVDEKLLPIVGLSAGIRF